MSRAITIKEVGPLGCGLHGESVLGGVKKRQCLLSKAALCLSDRGRSRRSLHFPLRGVLLWRRHTPDRESIVPSDFLPTTAHGRVSPSANRVAGASSAAPIPTAWASQRPTSQRLVDVLSLLAAHPLLNGSRRSVSLTDSSVTTGSASQISRGAKGRGEL